MLAPARFLHFMDRNRRAEHLTPACLPIKSTDQFPLMMNTNPEDATCIPRSLTMVRGGRYLLYISAYQLRLLDLWLSSPSSSATCVASCEPRQGGNYEVVDYWLSGSCQLCVAVRAQGERYVHLPCSWDFAHILVSEHALSVLQTSVSSQASRFRVRGQLTPPAICYGHRCGDLIAFYEGTTMGIWNYTQDRYTIWNCGRMVHEARIMMSFVVFILISNLRWFSSPMPSSACRWEMS